MDLLDAIRQRHSVRQYLDKPIDNDIARQLNDKIAEVNEKSGLNIQLVQNEPKAFDCLLAKYGKFKNAVNYFALVGKDNSRLEELCGYYGEQLVLFCQQLGLGTCWVAGSYKKVPSAVEIKDGEKLECVISVGYPENPGHEHKSKSPDEVSNITPSSPQWFENGVKAALLAPTAINQQKFFFTLNPDNTVSVSAGRGFYAKIDLGIAKYHFEVATGIKLL